MKEWRNWSGSLQFTPGEFVTPENEEALRTLVKRCYAEGRKVRLAAAGHSSSPLVQTAQTLIHLRHFKGVVNVDHTTKTAMLRSAMTVHELNEELEENRLALFNTGDVDVQTLAGAISTATHGTGRKLQNLSSMLKAVRMIDYKGEIHTFSDHHDGDMMKAMRVSLGCFGIFTTITVSVVPLLRLRRMELCADIEDCIHHFDQLADENRNVDFYWYPRSDEAKIRILNEPGEGTRSYPFKFRCKEDEEDWIGRILPKHRDIKFDEMEYSLPREAGLECFGVIRKRIRERHRKEVAWRVLVRTIAADDNYLSPHYGRESVSISIHHNAGLPFREFFSDLEPILLHYGGRPHWGKKHTMKAAQLQKLYPEWNKFQEIRRTLDPEGIFMNEHLQQLFIPDET